MKCACKSLVLFGCVCPLICSGSLWSFILQSKANTLLLKWSMLLGIKHLILLASSALCLSPWPMVKLYDLSLRVHILCSCLLQKLCSVVWGEIPCHVSCAQPGSELGKGGRMSSNGNESLAEEICLSPPCQGLAKCLDTHGPWETLKSCVMNRTETWVSCTRAWAKFSSSERSGSCMPEPVFCCAVRGLIGQISSAQCWILGHGNVLQWLNESVKLGWRASCQEEKWQG